MGKSDISSLSTFECRSVLDSIQNEYDQLQKEENSLSKLHEELADLIAQRNILAKRKSFNEKNCIICCLAFNLLFKRKLFCENCRLWVCRSCATWDQLSKQWYCHVCEKQKLLDAASSEWICNRIKTSFGNFNSAKALQNFFRQRRISDSENDSGYGTAGDFMPLMKFLSSHSLNKDLKMTDLSSHDGDCEEEEEEIGDEEELHEIQDSIETILEGLLGGTLDDALVDLLYPHSPFYLNLFSVYHSKLVEVIENLSRALQKALHNLPTENGVTPTSAHAALKNVIAALVDECQDIPPLEFVSQEELEFHQTSEPSSFNFASVISSYESLVASAVINKVVEETQSKFKTDAYVDKISSSQETDKYPDDITPAIGENEEIFNNVLNSTAFDLPVQCVQIEEVEEITQEFTDSEDDKLSSISKYSNSRQNIDEVGIPKNSDYDVFIDLDRSIEAPTPFPEFGCDLVEDQMVEDSKTPCHIVSVASWEENWLFKKKKRLPLYSNLKYHLLTYCDEPPSMLIPFPSESTDFDGQDDLSSELSETHSTGTLDFSSDSEFPDVKESELKVEGNILSKSNIQAFCNSSPLTESIKVPAYKLPDLCHTNDTLNVIEHAESGKEILPRQVKSESPVFGAIVDEVPDIFSFKEENHEKYSATEDIYCTFAETPPRPGTIAEREHQKWLNAVPLKHNPYSAENISKRYRYNKKTGLQEQVSFEEFERKLSISSDSNETPPNKVNCGPKSIDSDLYKRDYYVNKEIEILGDSCSLQKISPQSCSSCDDCFVPLSEEALNSFEEKVYVKSGKVFTLENRIKRLEREIKEDTSLFSEPSKKLFPVHQQLQEMKAINGNCGDIVNNCKHLPLPSVKGLATKFNPESIKNSPTTETLAVPNKQDSEKLKKSRPCRKVHSLTARSLSREFRDLAKQNLPKPMNRTIPVPLNACEEGEREIVCSPESVQSSLSTTQGDNGHGYTSDESNTSSNSTSKLKGRRQISRSILERATYWERRAEQGLLSDASVNEEFPAIDMEE